ncbi:MAG: type II toxin-antitoxin system RelE/ParE family toxin, partial [Spirochaetaceae bacterium]|nr:type II toxin-antitoxin system RelE/ParE family toxin [Spirochaetaceae bacterium]
MRIFKNLWFSRFAEREGISDGELKAAVNRLETGRTDA